MGTRLTPRRSGMHVAGLLAVIVIALLLLAAHLVHAGFLPLAGLALLVVALLGVPRPWAARVLQAVLVVATVEWVLTVVALTRLRVAHGEPYLRLLLILGAVTLLSAAAALVLEHPRLRKRFGTHRCAASATTRD